MLLKTIVSRYLRNVATPQITKLENGVSEISVNNVKIYINPIIGQANLGERYLISDRGMRGASGWLIPSQRFPSSSQACLVSTFESHHG